MNSELRPIGVVSLQSLAKIGAAYYSAVGLGTLIYTALKGTPMFRAPIGFIAPLLDLTVTLRFSRALWAPGIFSQIFFSTILYALTGALSGFLCAVAYNFISKYFRVRINGGLN